MAESDILKTMLWYDPIVGVFIRVQKRNNKSKLGDIAGFVDVDGYRRIKFQGKNELAHRLAWLYSYGEWPSKEIDHINHRRDDNSIANLRQASRHQNAQNAKSGKLSSHGFRGVSQNKRNGRWEAAICAFGKRYHIGTFASPEEAHVAYCEKANELHGEFARAS